MADEAIHTGYPLITDHRIRADSFDLMQLKAYEIELIFVYINIFFVSINLVSLFHKSLFFYFFGLAQDLEYRQRRKYTRRRFLGLFVRGPGGDHPFKKR